MRSKRVDLASVLCRDPDDESYLQTALVGRADYIVSGDQDLLDLQAVNDLPIVMPADFERILTGQTTI